MLSQHVLVNVNVSPVELSRLAFRVVTFWNSLSWRVVTVRSLSVLKVEAEKLRKIIGIEDSGELSQKTN